MSDHSESQAQKLTWELKIAAWQEVEHLPLEEALRERLRRSARATKRLELAMPVEDTRATAGMVQEDEAEYGADEP